MDILRPRLLMRTAILRRLQTKLPSGVVCQMIEPIFTAVLRYALELVTDYTAEKDTILEELHSLHRGAMKAALGHNHYDHPSNEFLLTSTGQISVRNMSLIATACMAWKSLKHPEKCPLMRGRLENHSSLKQTRQRTF